MTIEILLFLFKQENSFIARKNFILNVKLKRYTTKLVAKGYSLRGSWFWWKKIPFIKLSSIRFLLFIVVFVALEKMDVKTTFLHMDLEENFFWKTLMSLFYKWNEIGFVGYYNHFMV